MTIEEAKTLIPDIVSSGRDQTWADLGCGSGTFTYALAEKLPKGSHIIAIDKSSQSLKTLHNGISINFQKEDVEKDISLPKLDGVLTANVLHYIPHKKELISRLKNILLPQGKWIVIEYEHRKPGPWVPFPIFFDELKILFLDYGFQSAEMIGKRPSVFGGEMYGALISK